MRQYKHLQLFVHANALANDVTDLRDGETSVFVRVGSDYKSNFYEYEVPLKLTAEGHYDQYSAADCRAVWPEENMIDIDLEKFTALKKNRNREKGLGNASYNQEFSDFDLRETEISIRENGAADITVESSAWGSGVGGFRRKWDEILPEERQRRYGAGRRRSFEL